MKTTVKKATSFLTILFGSVFGFTAYAAQVGGNTSFQSASDNSITQQVQTKLSADKVTSNSQINVSTQDGVVYLSGNLATEGEASSAIEAASSIEGVDEVDTSQLTVQDSEQPYEDAYITAKVKGTFIKEKLFGDDPIAATKISVETMDGVVYLTGTADNQAQINNAVSLTKQIEGVTDVQSKVTVTQQ